MRSPGERVALKATQIRSGSLKELAVTVLCWPALLQGPGNEWWKRRGYMLLPGAVQGSQIRWMPKLLLRPRYDFKKKYTQSTTGLRK